MKIRKEDTVLVISGKDRGKRGRVLRAFPKESRVIVEKVNMIKRHMRARRPALQAGIIEREAPIHISNVMLLCNKCHRPTRVGFQFIEEGRKVRVCKRCGEVID
jgi:large subunit ribosomal protein L24